MKKIYILLLLIAFVFICNGQNPGDVATNFGSLPGFDDTVKSIVTQSDGKILIGGEFEVYNGENANNIIRLNADGTRDTSFVTGTGFNHIVNSIVVQSDNKILVGGRFTKYNGVTAIDIIRLNPDGTIDSSFITGTGFAPLSTVSSILAQPDGKILVAGSFTTYNEIIANNIIRLNSDGSVDESFKTGTGFDSRVYSFAIQSDGKILCLGGFNKYNEEVSRKIVRLNLNGTKDYSFDISSNYNGIYCIAIQKDDKILLGGARNNDKYIIRLNGDGTQDTTFEQETGDTKDVQLIVVQQNGKIIINSKGITSSHLIRLNSDGTIDKSFSSKSRASGRSISGSGGSFGYTIHAMMIQPDGRIFVGGSFNIYNSINANRIVRLNSDGTRDFNFNTEGGFDNTVDSIVIQPDGKIIIGGLFHRYNGIKGIYMIRLNADGTRDDTFGTKGLGRIYDITLQPDGKILVSAYYRLENEESGKPRIVRLNTDGSIDSSFIIGDGFGAYQYANSIVVQPDGKILVGGNFSSFNGVSENYLIRLNSDGTKDSSFMTGTGVGGNVQSIAIQPDGKILIGGDFITYNGNSSKFIVRLNIDGTIDDTFVTGTGFNRGVRSIVVQPDGKILVGGQFNKFAGATEKFIIRLNIDGTKDESFKTGTGFDIYVQSIVLQSNGKIIAGGDFWNYNEMTANKIVRLDIDGTKDSSFTSDHGFTFQPGTDFNHFIKTLAIHPDGRVLVGGNFITYKNNGDSAFLIALNPGEDSLTVDSFSNSNSLVLWPNPTTDFLNIEVSENTKVLSSKIYDLQGKLVHENMDSRVNVSDLPDGIYVFKIKTEEGEIIKKFIKN